MLQFAEKSEFRVFKSTGHFWQLKNDENEKSLRKKSMKKWCNDWWVRNSGEKKSYKNLNLLE